MYSDENLSELLAELEKFSDETIKAELRAIANTSGELLGIDDHRYDLSFSMCAVAEQLIEAAFERPRSVFPNSPYVPEIAITRKIWNAASLLYGYAALIYMRSDILEERLAQVTSCDALTAFSKCYGKGRNNKTYGQVARNALSHGSFSMLTSGYNIEMRDRSDTMSIDIRTFIDLCRQVKRLYMLAFDVSRPGMVARHPVEPT